MTVTLASAVLRRGGEADLVNPPSARFAARGSWPATRSTPSSRCSGASWVEGAAEEVGAVAAARAAVLGPALVWELSRENSSEAMCRRSSLRSARGIDRAGRADSHAR